MIGPTPTLNDRSKAILDELRSELVNQNASPRRRKHLQSFIKQLASHLDLILGQLDPIKQPVAIFDPSNPEVIGRFVSLALVAQTRQSLDNVPKVYGSGVYAIYYNGDLSSYRPISGSETPIYVGQAAPAHANAKTPLEQGDKLSNRLSEHAKNIKKATATLNISDFEFRWLVVQSGWETAAEDYLIHLFKPIWNNETKLVFGIGKHGDNAKTRQNKRSPWDTLHPGREWAIASKEDAKSIAQITRELEVHFSASPVYDNLNSLLLSFLKELNQT